MAGKYVSVDTTELRKFVEKMERAGRGGGFKKELNRFLDSLGVDFLSHVQDAIIRAESVDTRLLLNSFQKGENGNVFIAQEGALQIEVGTNVGYASYVNDGHWLNPKASAHGGFQGIGQDRPRTRMQDSFMSRVQRPGCC